MTRQDYLWNAMVLAATALLLFNGELFGLILPIFLLEDSSIKSD